MLNQGFEELTKRSLLARFIKIFPGIQALVSGEGEAKDEQLLVSRASAERKRLEYELIVTKRIPENSRAIAAAREHGDLRENAEYKMAKQDQQLLMAQKSQLERELARARITDFSDANTDQISVGSVVDLRDNATSQLHGAGTMGRRSGESDYLLQDPARPRPAGQEDRRPREGEGRRRRARFRGDRAQPLRRRAAGGRRLTPLPASGTSSK